MKYIQFSIKHRPHSFSGLFGQESIKKELTKRAKTKEWPKAFLLKGPFGTGKTTVAQIIAMSIQCRDLDDEGNPCCKCDSCKSIISGLFDRDTIELDGGLNGKKDDIAELMSTVNIQPMYDKARVYIIEEADQLSSAALNSLLKLTENPKSNIHFIFLSMTQGGVTGAIQSRCQTFYFKSLGIKDTMFALRDVLQKESLWETLPPSFKMEGLSTIAENSKGSLREAFQLLEKCLQGEYYTAKDIQENLGIFSEALTYQIMIGLLNLTKDEAIWSSINSADPLELYNYMTAVLSGAMVYKQTGYLQDETKANTTRALIQYPGFEDLFLALTTSPVFTKPYIRRADILACLAKFYMDHQNKQTIQTSNGTASTTYDCTTVRTENTSPTRPLVRGQKR